MKKWISAMRLRTLPLAASSILTGSAVSWHESDVPVLITVLALLTTFLLQVLSNFANDYGDHVSGVDNHQRVGPTRALQSGAISRLSMRKALIITSGLAFVSGLTLIWMAFAPAGLFGKALMFLALGILAIIAALKYTMGNNPYGYKGFGDLFVFLFFGLTGVCGTSFLLAGHLDGMVFLPATCIGLLSAAVLNLNNLRDHVNDAEGGKRTMVVILGFASGKIYHVLLVVVGVVTGVIWTFLQADSFVEWFPVVPLAAQLMLLPKVVRTAEPAALDSELKKVALLTFAFSLVLFVTIGVL